MPVGLGTTILPFFTVTAPTNRIKGTPTAVAFFDASGNFNNDAANFNYRNTDHTLTVDNVHATLFQVLYNFSAPITTVVGGFSLTANYGLIKLQSAAPVTSSVVTAIQNPPFAGTPGTMLYIENINAADSITFKNAANTNFYTAADFVLKAGCIVPLMWNGTDWKLIGSALY